MTVLTAPRPVATLAGGGWELFTVCTARGYLGVRRGPQDSVSAVLGDLSPQGLAPTSGTSSVRLGHDGRVSVSCLSAPPALWSGRAGRRLVPEVPSSREELQFAPGDLLVLCSADVLEHLDHGLPRLLEVAATISEPSHRAHAVATDIEAATTEGAAVVAVWVPSALGRPVTTDEQHPNHHQHPTHDQHRPEEVRP